MSQPNSVVKPKKISGQHWADRVASAAHYRLGECTRVTMMTRGPWGVGPGVFVGLSPLTPSGVVYFVLKKINKIKCRDQEQDRRRAQTSDRSKVRLHFNPQPG